MHYELIWAFRQAVGLSAISFSATLQKDAAPIPNATEILELKTLTIKEIPKSS